MNLDEKRELYEGLQKISSSCRGSNISSLCISEDIKNIGCKLASKVSTIYIVKLIIPSSQPNEPLVLRNDRQRYELEVIKSYCNGTYPDVMDLNVTLSDTADNASTIEKIYHVEKSPDVLVLGTFEAVTTSLLYDSLKMCKGKELDDLLSNMHELCTINDIEPDGYLSKVSVPMYLIMSSIISLASRDDIGVLRILSTIQTLLITIYSILLNRMSKFVIPGHLIAPEQYSEFVTRIMFKLCEYFTNYNANSDDSLLDYVTELEIEMWKRINDHLSVDLADALDTNIIFVSKAIKLVNNIEKGE